MRRDAGIRIRRTGLAGALMLAVVSVFVGAPLQAQEKPAPGVKGPDSTLSARGTRRPPGTFYGFFADFKGTMPYLDDLRTMGIQCLLARHFGSDDPTPSADSDRLVLEAARLGMSCNIEIGNWVGGSRKDNKVARADMDTQMAKWRALLNGVLKRYCKNGTLWAENPAVTPHVVKYITIFDEPNGDFLTAFTGKTKAETYFIYLKAAYEMIKAWDPEIQVIGMNTDHATTSFPGYPIAWQVFIKDVHALGGGKYYDIVGMHPYTANNDLGKAGYREALNLLKAECVKNAGGEKPVCYTQIGYQQTKPKGLPRGIPLTEDMQANMVLRVFGLAAAHGLVQVDVMYYMDIPDFDAGFFETRKVNGKWVWRKQAYALQTMISLLPDPVLTRTICDGDDDCYIYGFNGKDGKEVIMAWTTAPGAVEKELEVKSDAAALVTKEGDRTPLVVKDGKVSMQLTASPVFVVK